MLSFLTKKTGLYLNKLAPGWTNSKIDALLFVPKSSQSRSARVPKGITHNLVKTSDGNVSSYQTGKGPTVVFVHGWGGGAYQFFPLMRGLARCGFSALAFDHLGHGKSAHKTATIHQFIATSNEILELVRKKSPEGLCAIVGHSTGCMAIANARPPLVRDRPLFLISPIFNYKLWVLKKLIKLELHPELLKKNANRFTKTYKRDYAKLELARKLDRYGDVTVIAHDKRDAESPIADSISFCKKYPLTKLLVTKEYDHERIINSESVWHELKSHLNYEDTTINFMEILED